MRFMKAGLRSVTPSPQTLRLSLSRKGLCPCYQALLSDTLRLLALFKGPACTRRPRGRGVLCLLPRRALSGEAA